jgi:hypothetical protein
VHFRDFDFGNSTSDLIGKFNLSIAFGLSPLISIMPPSSQRLISELLAALHGLSMLIGIAGRNLTIKSNAFIG